MWYLPCSWRRGVVRMVHLGLFFALLGTPLLSVAMGLGEIKLYSYLNQRLNAEVELLAVKPGEISSVEVALASYDTFRRLGVDRPSVLSQLRFAVSERGDQPLVKITSTDLIHDPYLDFILELSWRSGRVLREYTLLLDPIELAPKGAQQLVAPVVENRVTASGVSGEGRGSRTPQGELILDGVAYGPVQRGDTLWGIANEIRSSSGKQYSVNQVMSALHRDNPEAFIGGDINRLKSGVILKLGSDVALTSGARIAPSSAQIAQASAKNGSVAAGSSSAQTPSDKSRLQLVAPTEGREGRGQGGRGAAVSDSELRTELMLALELTAAQKAENESLKQRMADLQRQLDRLQQLIAVEDGGLAQLQEIARQQRIDKQLPDVVEPVAGTESADLTPTPEVIPTPDGGERVAENRDLQSPVTPEPEVEVQPEAVSQPQVQPQQQPMPLPQLQPAVAPDPLTAIIASLTASPLYLAGFGVILLLVIALMLLMIRRRRNLSDDTALPGSSSMIAAAAAGEASSFMSDLSLSGLEDGPGGSEDTEIDPLTEADVYIAYGRVKQAEELLLDSIDANPHRADYKLKLLELYYNSKNRDGFEDLVATNSSTLQDNEVDWAKVVTMGSKLCPDNPLFAGSYSPEMDDDNDDTLPSASENPLLDDVMDIGIDLDELSAEMESEIGEEIDIDLGFDFTDLEEGLDLDLGDGLKEEFSPKSGVADTAPEQRADEAPENDTEEVVAEDDLGLGDLDLDLEVEDLPLEEAETAAEDHREVADALSEVSDLDLTLDLDPESTTTAADEGALADLTMADLSIDLDALESEAENESGDDELSDLDMELELGISEADDETADDRGDEDLSDLATADLTIDLEALAEEGSEDDSSSDLEMEIDLGFSELESLEIPEVDGPATEPALSAAEIAEKEENSALSSELDDLFSGLDADLNGDSSGDDESDLDDITFELPDDEEDANDIDTRLDLARAYAEMGDKEAATRMLAEIVNEGDEQQKRSAQELITKLS
ncbi:MAG: hypothetical protein HQL48_03420 [Gammaproteobacteria bacterium]|nr:hypothetical protein [Gammaproteobacteria bacterium]